MIKAVASIIQWTLIAPVQSFFQFIYGIDPNLVLICPQNARILSANTLAFAKHLKNHSAALSFIILTKEKREYELLTNQFGPVVYRTFSYQGFIQFLKAGTICVSHGSDDFHPYLAFKAQKKYINLWHGMPIKNIGNFVTHLSPTRSNLRFNKILDAFVVSSQYEKEIFMKAFELTDKQVRILGLPKNDILYESTIKSSTFKVLYAPTFRDDGETVLFPFHDYDEDELKNVLKENDIEILIRYHSNEIDIQSRISINENIYFVNAPLYPDPQELLRTSNALITDYSGIYFDFMLTDRPTLFIPYDLKEYENKRGFLFDYHHHINGPIVQSQAEFINQLLKLRNHNDDYVKTRKRLKEKFHFHQNGNASRRISNLIIDLWSTSPE